MATTERNKKEADEKFKDLTECCICIESYKDPKMLPCAHTFCKKCLEDMGDKTGKKAGEMVPCPICRKEFTVPVNGFSGLPQNFFVEKLVDLRKILNPLSERILCEACLETMDQDTDTEPLPATVFCVECQQKLCTECCQHHKKFKTTKNHQLITLNSPKEDVIESVVTSSNFCEKHERNLIDVFCSSCKEVLCSSCFSESHKTHEWSKLEKVVGTFRDQILENIQSLSSFQIDLEDRSRELKESRAEFLKNMEELDSEINRRRLELKELVDKDADSLLSRVNKLKQERLKENEAKKDIIETLLISVNSLKTLSQQVTEKGSEADICKAFINMNQRVNEMKQNYVVLGDCCPQVRTISLEKMHLQDFHIHNIIGELKETGDDRDEKEDITTEEFPSEIKEIPSQDEGLLLPTINSLLNEIKETENFEESEMFPAKQVALHKDDAMKGKNYFPPTGTIDYTAQPKFHSVIETVRDKKTSDYQINGLAILGNELFVLVCCVFFEVFDLSTLMLKRRWELKLTSNVYDVTQCERKNCLYMMSSNLPSSIRNARGPTRKLNHEIIHIDVNGTVINCWSVAVDGRLSVTYEGNILITSLKQNALYEYTPDGKLVRTIPLSLTTGITNPWHAIKLTSCYFLISHGKDNDHLRGVSMVDDVGNVNMRFCGTFQRPIYLYKDSKENILVAEFSMGQLVALNPDLEIIKRYRLKRTREGLSQPSKMIVDELNGRLFVIELASNNYRLAVYALKKH